MVEFNIVDLLTSWSLSYFSLSSTLDLNHYLALNMLLNNCFQMGDVVLGDWDEAAAHFMPSL